MLRFWGDTQTHTHTLPSLTGPLWSDAGGQSCGVGHVSAPKERGAVSGDGRRPHVGAGAPPTVKGSGPGRGRACQPRRPLAGRAELEGPSVPF